MDRKFWVYNEDGKTVNCDVDDIMDAIGIAFDVRGEVVVSATGEVIFESSDSDNRVWATYVDEDEWQDVWDRYPESAHSEVTS